MEQLSSARWCSLELFFISYSQKTIRFYCEALEHENLSGNESQTEHFSTSLSNHRRRNEKMFTGELETVLITHVQQPLVVLIARDFLDFKPFRLVRSFKISSEGVWNWYFPTLSIEHGTSNVRKMKHGSRFIEFILLDSKCECCFLTHETETEEWRAGLAAAHNEDDAHTACSLGFHPPCSSLLAPPFCLPERKTSRALESARNNKFL